MKDINDVFVAIVGDEKYPRHCTSLTLEEVAMADLVITFSVELGKFFIMKNRWGVSRYTDELRDVLAVVMMTLDFRATQKRLMQTIVDNKAP